MDNPFRYGAVVSGQDFCGREQSINELTDFMTVGQNIVLQGERRVGKTSLVYETARRLKKQRMLLAVDLMEVKTTEDVCRRVLRAIVQLEKSSSLGGLLKSLSHLRPSISFNSMTGDYSVGIEAGENLGPESVTDILKLIARKNARKSLLVFFDEFQDVLKLTDSRELLAQMRGEIQHQGDVPYIFAGSVRNQMDEIFNHPNSAFFKAAIKLDVGPLSQDDFKEFLTEKFLSGDRCLLPEIVPDIFELAESVTGDVQQICQALWSVSKPGEEVSLELLPMALDLIFSREKKSYEIILAGLTAKYLNILKTLSCLGGKQVTSAEFVRKAKAANGSSVRKALVSMADRKIVFKAEDRWRFTNPFFGVWLQQL